MNTTRFEAQDMLFLNIIISSGVGVVLGHIFLADILCNKFLYLFKGNKFIIKLKS